MTAPFAVKRANGLVFVERAKDEAFRKALMDGIPPVLRGKMREALAAIPDKGSMAHAVRYFGGPEKIADIKNQIAPMIVELDKFLKNSRNLPGLFDWLDVTGLGNDYRMIKVFIAWSEFELSKSNGR